MKSAYWLMGIGCLFSMSVFAQDAKIIDGRARMYDGKIVPATIVNKNSKEEIKLDGRGYFMINTQVGDTIQFSNKRISTVDYVMTEEDFKLGRINVVFTKPGQTLEEVVILHKNFDDDLFEIGNKKKLTPAERRYKKNNTVFASTANYGMGISLDALANLVSGKKKKDKTAILYERLDIRIQEFVEEYPKSDLLTDMKIPKDRIDAFLYYVVAQPEYGKIKIERTEEYQLYLAKQYADFVGFLGL